MVLQRNWRRRGFLPAKTERIAAFSPLELAAVRVMTRLRKLNVGPSASRSIAEEAGRSVLWLALVNHPESWTVAGDAAEAEAYRQALEARGHEHIDAMAGVTGEHHRYCVILEGRRLELVASLDKFHDMEGVEMSQVLALDSLAENLVRLAGRPFVSVYPPNPHDEGDGHQKRALGATDPERAEP